MKCKSCKRVNVEKGTTRCLKCWSEYRRIWEKERQYARTTTIFDIKAKENCVLCNKILLKGFYPLNGNFCLKCIQNTNDLSTFYPGELPAKLDTTKMGKKRKENYERKWGEIVERWEEKKELYEIRVKNFQKGLSLIT